MNRRKGDDEKARDKPSCQNVIKESGTIKDIRLPATFATIL